MTDKVSLGKLSTGVPGLDMLLGGGLSEFSFNLIAGAPGCGKTTLAHQIMFSLANADRRALFFTVLGEPPLKMLRYQQQYSFFQFDKVGTAIRYVNLADDLRAVCATERKESTNTRLGAKSSTSFMMRSSTPEKSPARKSSARFT